MSFLRLLGTGLYVGYLVQAGLLMIVLPWSKVWGILMTRMPIGVAWLLDSPAVRGAITGFGVLHLAMVVLELMVAGNRERRARIAVTRAPNPETPPQDPPRS